MDEKKKLNEKISIALSAALVLLLATALFLSAYWYDNKYTALQPTAKKGALLLDEQAQQEFPVVFLINGWEYYGGKLLAPEDFTANPLVPDQYIFIGKYGGFEAGDKTASPHGSASYRLTIKLPDEKRTYLLELPEIFSAYRLYVNGELAAGMGNPDPQSYRPEAGNQFVSIEAAGSIELLFAVTDYSHLYSGMVYPPAFGQPKAVSDLLSARLAFRLIVCAIALSVGLFALLIGFISRRNPSALLYGLLCVLFIGTISYPIWQTFFPGYAAWYVVERVSFCGMLAVVMLITKKVCGLKEKWSVMFLVYGALMCVAAAILPLLLPTGNLQIMRTYSALISAYEWITAIFITAAAVRAVFRNTAHTRMLLYGILIFDCALVMDRLLPVHEPIVTGWFIELASFALVFFVGMVIAREVAERYRDSAVLAERAGSMERLYGTQLTYFEVLKQEMEEAKKMRHDMRHHFTMLNGFVQNRQYDELSAYMSEYSAAFRDVEPMCYCPLNVINVLAFHYDTLSEQNHIHFEMHCDFLADDESENKKHIAIADADLCSLFSNLMENAVEACLRIKTGRRSICVAVINASEGHLLIRVQNSTDGNVSKEGEVFLSSKAEGRKGYGLASITSIAKKYDGSASFVWDREKRMFDSKVTMQT